jgi:hypothetical protein
VGQFVRVKKQYTIKDHMDIRDLHKYEVTVAEGLVTSTLFDESFEVSYVLAETPISKWFNLQDISDLEVL